jgi:hypothetical protein
MQQIGDLAIQEIVRDRQGLLGEPACLDGGADGNHAAVAGGVDCHRLGPGLGRLLGNGEERGAQRGVGEQPGDAREEFGANLDATLHGVGADAVDDRLGAADGHDALRAHHLDGGRRHVDGHGAGDARRAAAPPEPRVVDGPHLERRGAFGDARRPRVDRRREHGLVDAAAAPREARKAFLGEHQRLAGGGHEPHRDVGEPGAPVARGHLERRGAADDVDRRVEHGARGERLGAGEEEPDRPDDDDQQQNASHQSPSDDSTCSRLRVMRCVAPQIT